MIASLRGTVQSTTLNSVVLDVSGVGYLVQITPALALSLQAGQDLSVVTSFIVREDAFTIFGFLTLDELRTFELLLTVTGVGPKLAMSVIHQLGVEALGEAVASENDAAFKNVSGIGPKTAKLLVVTLAGKLSGGSGGKTSNADSELVTALVGLGYQSKVAEGAIKSARAAQPAATSEQLLRSALQSLAR